MVKFVSSNNATQWPLWVLPRSETQSFRCRAQSLHKNHPPPPGPPAAMQILAPPGEGRSIKIDDTTVLIVGERLHSCATYYCKPSSSYTSSVYGLLVGWSGQPPCDHSLAGDDAGWLAATGVVRKATNNIHDLLVTGSLSIQGFGSTWAHLRLDRRFPRGSVNH